mgnify:FL=1
MSNLINFNIDTLSKILFVIETLESVWSRKNKNFNNETIGRHIRHIIDFYLCFIGYIDSNFIDYDARKRSAKIESDISFARNKIEEIIYFLKNTDLVDKNIKVRMNSSVYNLDLNSSIFRELMHIADHAIHHANLVQVIIKNEFPDLERNCNFYSPSTIDSKRCAQ